MKEHLFLLAAIIFEVLGTTALKASQGFTRPWPTVILLCSYIAALWCLSFPMRTMPTGIIYAIWSAVGIVLIAAIDYLFNRQSLDTPAIIGLALIILGVVIVNLCSKSVVH